MAKVPTRSPTHEEVDPGRLPAMGLELEDLADADGRVALDDLVELAEDRGRPPSAYVAALQLATELRLARPAGSAAIIACVGNCQRYGALDLVEQIIASPGLRAHLDTSACLDQCDKAPACRVDSAEGTLTLAPATLAEVTDALSHLSQPAG